MQTLDWQSPITYLFKKTSNTCKLLNEIGIKKLQDLLWIFPNSIDEIPPVAPFHQGKLNQLFKGQGKVLSIQKKPNLYGKGKKGIKLYNLTVLVRDLNGDRTLSLKWFNAYPSLISSIEQLEFLSFYGELSVFGSNIQIVNPYFQALDLSFDQQSFETKINYPALNTIKSTTIGMLLEKIPSALWDNIPEHLPSEIVTRRQLLSLRDCFKIMHGKLPGFKEKKEAAIKTLAYHEFFHEQIKILSRRSLVKKPKSLTLTIQDNYFQHLIKLFPYDFTEGQISSLSDIRKDLKSGHPMMRLLQGDVGSGKTTVALISILIALKSGVQAALMCPTEALALQHSLTFSAFLKNEGYNCQLIISSTRAGDKKNILNQLKEKKIDLIIGTQSLIQDSVEFNKLGLVVIDEQHKFGVEQRIKLLSKGEGVHCLVMTATPIPRSLSLTQYGDLDISAIKELPKLKKQIKTKIVTNQNFQKFLSFLKTRLLMKEQIYVVVPAIEESPELDILNLEEVFTKFNKLFSEFKVAKLHGKMKPHEKEDTIKNFLEEKINLLISTSVIEVGINVPNATVMAILNPERFGLSSLHQLRGRVGRGEKPGFCFLVLDKQVSIESMNRLSVIEKNTDGFLIAEEDLKIRGEGDLFGKDQSGKLQSRRVASLLNHADILIQAREDVEEQIQANTTWIREEMETVLKDSFVTQTI
jgi:ATP-dependent DNA helicase RecG